MDTSDPKLEVLFPNLKKRGYRVTSPFDVRYNCIAWAVKDNTKFWWPSMYTYWPESVPMEETVEAFVILFRSLGYEPCVSDEYEAGYEKLALYTDTSGRPTHAARQIHTGQWTSKMGKEKDIVHNTLDALSGTGADEKEHYGTAEVIFRKPID